jgi:cathepsin L
MVSKACFLLLVPACHASGFLADNNSATPASIAADIPETMSFEVFVRSFGKQYEATELEHRRSAFEENVLLILKHNSEADAGKHTWRCGVNIMSDLTYEEYRKQYLNPAYPTPTHKHTTTLESTGIPATVDWRLQGAGTCM